MFVCTGNICRSPMAEAIFKDLVKDAEVSSSGISALTGERASFNAIAVCKENGLELSDHRSTHIFDSDIEKMDLILTATDNHSYVLKKQYPQLNIYTIKEYAGDKNLNIADPYGGSLHDYEVCFSEIKEALEKICESKPEFENVKI